MSVTVMIHQLRLAGEEALNNPVARCRKARVVSRVARVETIGF